MMTGITSVTLLAQEIRGAHEKEFLENREAGVLGAAEQRKQLSVLTDGSEGVL